MSTHVMTDHSRFLSFYYSFAAYAIFYLRANYRESLIDEPIWTQKKLRNLHLWKETGCIQFPSTSCRDMFRKWLHIARRINITHSSVQKRVFSTTPFMVVKLIFQFQTVQELPRHIHPHNAHWCLQNGMQQIMLIQHPSFRIKFFLSHTWIALTNSANIKETFLHSFAFFFENAIKRTSSIILKKKLRNAKND